MATRTTDPGAIRDAVRTGELSKQGITVLRFWNDDVRKYPDQCWEKIVEAVEALAMARRGPSP